MKTLKNPLLTGFLYNGGKFTSGNSFRSLHENVRKFYLHFFAPAFEWYLRQTSGESRLRLIPRHSVEEKDGFNLFMSDLDFSLVFPSEPLPLLCERVVKKYFQMRQIFKFVGELEIYTESEWTLKTLLTKKNRPVLEAVRNIRKWSQQKRTFNCAETDYHRYKALRSIRRILMKLGLDRCVSRFEAIDDLALFDQEVVRNLFSTILNSEGIEISKKIPKQPGKSEYLGWEFSEIHPYFLAILPDGDIVFPEAREHIDSLRNIPALSRALSALCALDLLSMESRRRAFGENPEICWSERLRNLLLKYEGIRSNEDPEEFRELRNTLFKEVLQTR